MKYHKPNCECEQCKPLKELAKVFGEELDNVLIIPHHPHDCMCEACRKLIAQANNLPRATF